MKIAQEKSKQHHDKKAKMPDFKVSDRVLLKSMKVPKGHSPKLYTKHEGPFYITELGPNFTYKLTSCADHTEIKCLINASRLQRYVKPDLVRNENQLQARVPPLEPEIWYGKSLFNRKCLDQRTQINSHLTKLSWNCQDHVKQINSHLVQFNWKCPDYKREINSHLTQFSWNCPDHRKGKNNHPVLILHQRK